MIAQIKPDNVDEVVAKTKEMGYQLEQLIEVMVNMVSSSEQEQTPAVIAKITKDLLDRFRAEIGSATRTA
jgi:hypothetical protein